MTDLIPSPSPSSSSSTSNCEDLLPTDISMEVCLPSSSLRGCSDKCAVCGKPAFCYNYGVLTCNACKMFFRRVEVEKVIYTCKYANKCYLRNDDLSFKCKSCRFKLCLLAGMKYIPPGKPTLEPRIRSSKDETMSALISNLLFLDARRRHKFHNFFTSEDPTLQELLERPKGAITRMTVKSEDQDIDCHVWSFLGIYTSIELFMSMEFMDPLSIKDKSILIHNFAIKSMLFSGGQRTVDEKRDMIMTPDLKDVYPDTLYQLISLEFLKRIRTILVARLIELQVTKEEHALLNVILFCNSAVSHLSPSAQSLISSRQKTYSNALLQYCLLTYQQAGPSRFSDLLSLCHVINRNFEDVHYLTTLVQFYMPHFKFKKLYMDLLRSVDE